ncbi:hypothetical protein MKX03_015702, partial [Papaver bracteatum]
MSWYRDPQLFIYGAYPTFYIFRVTKEFGINPVANNDFRQEAQLSFSTHLSLSNNKESDFDSFKATFVPKSGIHKFANSQGLVINWDPSSKQTGYWSSEGLDSPFWSLPGITVAKPKSVTEQALEEKVSALEARNFSLQDEVNSNK